LAKPSVEELMAVESRLNWSLGACVVALVAVYGWAFAGGGAVVALLLVLFQIGCYVWFALSAGAAARILGEAPWKYVVWILVAPFLALIPIPIVSTIIGVSPLSIKFLLGGQLDTAIRERPFQD
jgi:hypothetical protein